MPLGGSERKRRTVGSVVDLHGSAIATALIAARMGCQALVLVGVARLMGVHGYGAFAAVVALASVFGPFCGLGADFVALRAVAEEPGRAREVFHRTLVITALTGLPLLGLAWMLAASGFAAHASATLITAVMVADLLLMRVTELVAKIFQGNSQVLEMGLVRLLPALFRLLAVGGLLLQPVDTTPATWALCYLAASALAAASGVGLMYRRFPLQPGAHDGPFRWRDGLHFAGGVVSVRMHTEADKAMVMSLSGATGAGVYAAAYRIIEFALVPVGGIVAAAYGRLFAQARHAGHERLTRTALQSSFAALSLGVVVGAVLWSGLVPFMGWILGPEFAAVAEGRHALALLPVFMSLRMTGEQNVAALGILRTRTLVQWSVALSALLANAIVIPRAGWTGSVWICVAAEAVLGLAYLALVLRRHGEEKRA